MIVKHNQIGFPRSIIGVLEQRRIRCQLDNVLIALHPGQKHCLCNGTLYRCNGVSSINGIFAQENLRSASIVGIKPVVVLQKELRCTVIVFIHHFGGQPITLGMGVRDVNHIRVSRFQRLVKFLIARKILRAMIFISNLQILQPKRRRVACSGTHSAVMAVDRTKGILQRTQCLLQQCVNLCLVEILCHTGLTAHSAIADIHWLHVQILAQLQKFMIAKAVGCAIVPHQVVAGALPNRPDGVGKPHGSFQR